MNWTIREAQSVSNLAALNRATVSSTTRIRAELVGWVGALTLILLSTIYSSPARAQMPAAGGLTAPEIGGSLGPNLSVNGDFSLGTTGWTFRPAASV